MRLRALSLLVLPLTLLMGCLVVPYKPASSQPRQDAVEALDARSETWASLRAKLGTPNVVDFPSVAMWEWEGDRTDLFWGFVTLPHHSPASAGSGSLQGSPKVFRVLAWAEGDQVVRIDRDIAHYRLRRLGSDPDQTWGAWSGERKRRRGPVLAPTQVIAAQGPDALTELAAMPNGQWVVADARGALWSDQGRPLGPLTQLLGPIEAAAEGGLTPIQLGPDPSGRFLVLAHPQRLRIWDLRDLRLALDLERPQVAGEERAFAGIRGLAFSPDGRWLAVLDECASVILASETWRCVRWIPGSEASRAAFSPDGRRLVLLGQRLQILDASTGVLLADLADPPHGSLAMSGSRLVVAGVESLFVDLETGEEKGRLKGLQPDSDPAVRFASERQLSVYRRETLERWDLARLDQAFQAADRRIDLASRLGSTALVELRMVPISPGSLFPQYAISERRFSPDGHWLVDHWHPYLQILSAATLAPVGHIRLPENRVEMRFGFSEDGRFFVLTPREIRVWELAPAAPIRPETP